MGSSESATHQATEGEASEKVEWQWPEWALDRRSDRVEVFVLDPHHEKGGAWVRAMPQMRVVDGKGQDAYLCAQYCWRGDQFEEDFGPDRVRKCGERATVWELIFCPTSGTERHQAPPRFVQSTADGPQICAVCMDKPCDAILQPCLHGGLCEACAQKIASMGAAGGARCPQCRTLIEQVVKVGVRRSRQETRASDRRAGVQSGGHVERALDEVARKWRWPSWCQDQAAGLLEVYIVDSQFGWSQWVPAVPVTCVVDGRGEKYLCAEYEWDNDRYAEDFSTDRIRRKGEILTLRQQLLLERDLL